MTTNTAGVIILIGRPGCGKGTQAQIMSKDFKVPLLSTGDRLRQLSKNDKQLAAKMKEGALLSPEVVNGIMIDAIADYIQGGKRVILDGYPRNLEQALFLDTQYPSLSQKVLYFSAPVGLLVNRIIGRFACRECDKIYNSCYNPPKIANKCDDCGSDQFSRREDDTEEIVKKRLEEYDRQTLPLIEFYKNKGILHTIDASQDIENIRLEASKLMTSV